MAIPQEMSESELLSLDDPTLLQIVGRLEPESIARLCQGSVELNERVCLNGYFLQQLANKYLTKRELNEKELGKVLQHLYLIRKDDKLDGRVKLAVDNDYEIALFEMLDTYGEVNEWMDDVVLIDGSVVQSSLIELALYYAMINNNQELFGTIWNRYPLIKESIIPTTVFYLPYAIAQLGKTEFLAYLIEGGAINDLHFSSLLKSAIAGEQRDMFDYILASAEGNGIDVEFDVQLVRASLNSMSVDFYDWLRTNHGDIFNDMTDSDLLRALANVPILDKLTKNAPEQGLQPAFLGRVWPNTLTQIVNNNDIDTIEGVKFLIKHGADALPALYSDRDDTSVYPIFRPRFLEIAELAAKYIPWDYGRYAREDALFVQAYADSKGIYDVVAMSKSANQLPEIYITRKIETPNFRHLPGWLTASTADLIMETKERSIIDAVQLIKKINNWEGNRYMIIFDIEVAILEPEKIVAVLGLRGATEVTLVTNDNQFYHSVVRKGDACFPVREQRSGTRYDISNKKLSNLLYVNQSKVAVVALL